MWALGESPASHGDITADDNSEDLLRCQLLNPDSGAKHNVAIALD